MLLILQARASHLSVIFAHIALRQAVCCSLQGGSALFIGLLGNFLKSLAEGLRLSQTPCHCFMRGSLSTQLAPFNCMLKN